MVVRDGAVGVVDEPVRSELRMTRSIPFMLLGCTLETEFLRCVCCKEPFYMFMYVHVQVLWYALTHLEKGLYIFICTFLHLIYSQDKAKTCVVKIVSCFYLLPHNIEKKCPCKLGVGEWTLQAVAHKHSWLPVG